MKGRRHLLEIALRTERLVVEIGGRIHERGLALFESDRWQQNALVQEGRCVLRSTWAMLVERPDVFVAEVARARQNQRQMALRAPRRSVKRVER